MSTRRLVTAVVFSFGLTCGIPTDRAESAQASRQDPCLTGEAAARVSACTATIDRPNSSPAVKASAYAGRGIAHDTLGHLDLALKDFQAALDIDANSGFALRSRALVLYNHGQLADARTDLTRAVALHPDDVAALRIRGLVYADLGEMARATEDFSKVLDQQPGDLSAREGRGLALAALGEHGRAIQDFTRVLERDPRMRVARAARAFSLFRTRQYRQAIADWDQLLAADPSQLAVIYCRGAAKVLSGDAAGGQADIESVRRQKPEVAAAQAAACPTPASGN